MVARTFCSQLFFGSMASILQEAHDCRFFGPTGEATQGKAHVQINKELGSHDSWTNHIWLGTCAQTWEFPSFFLAPRDGVGLGDVFDG